jgi:hypothetical protein
MNFTSLNTKPSALSTSKFIRTYQVALIFLCVVLLYAVLSLGVNTVHGCRKTHSTPIEQSKTAVRIVLRNHTSYDATSHGTSKEAEDAAATVATAEVAAGSGQLLHASSTANISQRLVVSSILFQLPERSGLPSDAWRPHIYTKCAAGMPQGYAPCLKYSNLLQGEELVYPGKQLSCTDQ